VKDEERTKSTGQSSLIPSQVSSRSQRSDAALQTVVVGSLTSIGQFGPDPSQVSSVSQSPTDALQTPEVANESAGQVLDEPVQVSATSQTPADARQTIVLFVFADQSLLF
jgi:hypothetical protein